METPMEDTQTNKQLPNSQKNFTGLSVLKRGLNQLLATHGFPFRVIYVQIFSCYCNVYLFFICCIWVFWSKRLKFWRGINFSPKILFFLLTLYHIGSCFGCSTACSNFVFMIKYVSPLMPLSLPNQLWFLSNLKLNNLVYPTSPGTPSVFVRALWNPLEPHLSTLIPLSLLDQLKFSWNLKLNLLGSQLVNPTYHDYPFCSLASLRNHLEPFIIL